jgi:hypothetical protein
VLPHRRHDDPPLESGALTHASALRCGVGAAVFAALAIAAPAQGATTIGSGLDDRANLAIACGTPGEATSLCTSAQIALPDRPITAPFDGVIVRWRMRAANSGNASLRVLRPAGGGKFAGAGTSAPITLTAPGVAGQDRSYFATTRLPVVQGDYIGLDHERRTGAIYAQRGGTGFELVQYDLPLANGDAQGPDSSYKGAELLVNADVEVDKDGDGFGDETQDNCPSIPNDQTGNPCPSDPVGQGDPGTDDPGTSDDEGRQFRRHRAKRHKRPKRHGRKTHADKFRSHR